MGVLTALSSTYQRGFLDLRKVFLNLQKISSIVLPFRTFQHEMFNSSPQFLANNKALPLSPDSDLL